MPSRRTLANALRALSMDAVQRANSGHPGMPMGMADIAEVLWNDFLSHNPANPNWSNRDRFILSNGHGSMLQYALLHLTGYDLSLDELKNFRQLNSQTPGHPEFGYTPGVEVTTGPLGQGLTNAVGMAIAEKHLAAQFNQPDFPIVDHYTYVFTGDGCLMEGISHEACSLAGTLGLNKLITFWDDNGISIDGDVKGWFTDDTPKRFESYGWHVIANVDGHDPEAIRQAILAAQAETEHPTIICCKTQIGFGSPNLAGSEKTHGAPLGDDEIAATRKHLEWPHAPFTIPTDLSQAWDARAQGQSQEAAWNTLFKAYAKAHPALAKSFTRRTQNALPDTWENTAHTFITNCQAKSEDVATRKASQNTLTAFANILPELFGGSADLSGSNCTMWSDASVFGPRNPAGNYLHYGVREFAMSAIMNGIARHGGMIPFGGTFLVFCDYARNAVRLAAMMKQHVIFIYSHDSIGLGEDGPTHQPIEHVAMLRLTPGINVWRPCDATETAVAWQCAIAQNTRPSCLLLSRQKLAHQPRDPKTLANVERGGYILSDCEGIPDAILIATGSEIELAMAAQQQLTSKRIRVVSMPCTEVFDEQPKAYRDSVLPPNITQRIAIEASAKDYWYKYVGLDGRILGLETFGESAPYKDLYQHFGLTVENLVDTVNQVLIHQHTAVV